MSDTMLHGVLKMPPECWTNDPIDQMQRHGRYIQASERIERLTFALDDIWACANSGYTLEDLKEKIALYTEVENGKD